MSQTQDAQVIKSALETHLSYLRTASSAHRMAGRALSQRPQHPDLIRAGQSPIAVSAAHRARAASFGQRAEFVEQLLDFPTSGLRALGPSDMRTLQVAAHIGSVALPEQVARTISERDTTARLQSAQPTLRTALEPEAAPRSAETPDDAAPAPFSPAPPKKKIPWHKRRFEDILRGRK